MDLYENITVTEATVIQKELRTRLDIKDRRLSLETIAGADVSLNLFSRTVYAGIVVLSFPSLLPISYSLVKSETRFPYVPGYLAFREVSALLKAWTLLPSKPSVVVTDGHGIAHQRRVGIATHMGMLTGQPTMGCAKKILVGNFDEPALTAGSSSPLVDKDEQVGYAFRSKNNTAPVFISPGHRLGLKNSLEIIRACTGRYRIPEPTRLAHAFVNDFRKGMLTEGYHII